MSDIKQPNPTPIRPPPAPAIRQPPPGPGLRRMLYTAEERAKIKGICRQICGFMYPEHGSRWIAKYIREAFEVFFGEPLMDPEPTRGAVGGSGGGTTQGVLPGGATKTYAEVKDAEGRLIKEVIDGVVYDVSPTGERTLSEEG